MGYTWGYIKDAALAKLDLSEAEANDLHLLDRFHIYANEVITQVCSTIKPDRTFVQFVIGKSDVGAVKQVSNENFVSFGNDVNTVDYYTDGCNYFIDSELKGNATYRHIVRSAHDSDFTYVGHNSLKFYHEGVYNISVNTRWFTFTSSLKNNVVLDIPTDILECIPSYIASQCYKIDDEVKSSIYRNEFELLYARIDNTDYSDTKDFEIGGGW